MRVLGIESSCDDTGVAIYDGEQGLMAHALSSQTATHARFGGVVPELASRCHVHALVPLVQQVLNDADIEATSLDAIAYTAGPGLIGALLTGACFAKAYAVGLSIPALGVHHLEAHLLAAQLDFNQLSFPLLGLLVSGGHTQFIDARGLGDYHLLGETLDDSVGEAFDKTAKLMGIPYPGGPILADLADTCPPSAYLSKRFPRPMIDRPNLDLSFSGLKTHALQTWQKSAQDDAARSGVAAAFQAAIVETLLIKSQRALTETGYQRLVVAGGVGANQSLREGLSTLMRERGGEVFFPRQSFCTDNGAMVAYAGYLRLMQGEKDSSSAVVVKARWPFGA